MAHYLIFLDGNQSTGRPPVQGEKSSSHERSRMVNRSLSSASERWKSAFTVFSEMHDAKDDDSDDEDLVLNLRRGKILFFSFL